MMNFYVTLILAFILGLLAFYYTFLRNVMAFRRAGILFQMPVPLLGNMGSIIFGRKSVSDLVREVYDMHPTAKYVGFMDLLTPIIVIRDVDLIKQIAVKHFDIFTNHRVFIDGEADELFGKNLSALEGERWREVRNMLSPAFTSSKIKQMFKLMSDCARDFADYMAKLPNDKNKCIDTKDAFTRYTTDVIATCAFGITTDSMKNPNNDFYTMGKKATSFDGYTMLKIFVIRCFPKLSALLGIAVFGKKVTEFFTTVVSETIRMRDEKGIRRPDMIQLMMDTRGKLGEGKELTPMEMTSQAFIFFFGGFDTTSATMCFAAYEIAVNPDVQSRLLEEIDAVMEECNGEPTYDKINQMEYLDAILYESLRKWTVAPGLDRVCSSSFELPPALPGKKPYVLEKGSAVMFPCNGLQYDPGYFDEPEKFMPERFLDKQANLVNHPAFFPFGLGPRMCIGTRFAMLKMKAMLFYLVHRCELSPSAKTQIPLELKKGSFSIQAANGFWLQVQPRTDRTNVPH